VIERYDWFRITDLALEGDRPINGSMKVELAVAEADALSGCAFVEPLMAR
jgi:hypothetical protein